MKSRVQSKFIHDNLLHKYNLSKSLIKFEIYKKRIICHTCNLRSEKELDLAKILNSSIIQESWHKLQKKLIEFNLPIGTDGVNPGDQRALYYLIRGFKPKNVLEIGTHIGASTIHLASGLFDNAGSESVNLTTVDIRDVNSKIDKPWLKYASKFSPFDMINKLSYSSFVDFRTQNSVEFLKENYHKYDFIFLDGDHSALMVYQEVPLALKALKKNGLILLHDYFPAGKSLWKDNYIIYGPYIALKRLMKEGANFKVEPLGCLPWITKKGSCLTSLALILRKK